jgi:hypothetical protein
VRIASVRYNDEPMLAENTTLPPLRKKDFFEGQKEKKGKEEKKEKAPKGGAKWR